MLLVEWVDSNIIHGWRDIKDGTDDVAHCRTIGFVQFEDSEKLVMSMGYSDWGAVLETINIPLGCIILRKELRVK